MNGGTVAKMPQTETSDPHTRAKARSARLHNTSVSVNHERRVIKVVHGAQQDSQRRAERATGRNKRADLRALADEFAQALEAGCALSSRVIAHVCPLSGRNIFSGRNELASEDLGAA
jgi:uncharacterized protein (DUF2252 family)